MARKINRIDRLARSEEKDIVKRIFLLSFISVVIIIVLFTAGTSFLGKFADLVSSVSKKKSVQDAASSFIQTPVLDSLPQATNSASLKISGFSADGKQVDVYLGGEKVGGANIDNGRFTVSEIQLKTGENEIKVKALGDSGSSSDFSQSVKISYDKKEPQLEVITPTDGQNFSGNNKIPVEGKTEGDAQVFANGFLANVGSDGKFDVSIPLSEGENNVEVKAIDEAGNAKIIKLKVNYKK